MERVSVLCLSLLLCSLSGTEIIEQREVSPESVNVPQPGASDLHAVLREMSVKLAENRLMIQQLQTLNQEQAAKLKQLEKQSSHMDSQQQAQTAALHRIEAWSNVTETQVQTLTRTEQVSPLDLHYSLGHVCVLITKTHISVGQVAFSASLLASGHGHTGPFNTRTTLVFRGVVSNIGNAYNPHTGIFTAPVRGAYHFEFYVFGSGGSPGSVVGLTKNGEHIFLGQQVQSTGWGSGSNGATLLLEAGDVVFLRLWPDRRIYDDPSRYNTFSGHLLFPM
uniref:C1q domain-containing protein n=1 Tax=Neogobius melanostomus TaxID=47308 RepID=A0A8C6UJ35_9GOBI